MSTYDLSRLAELGQRYARERAAVEKTREELAPEIIAAARAKVRQSEIVRATGYTRERIRQICRAAGVEPGE